MDSTPKANPTTDAGATLGRVLFYDTRLSADRKVSCATCHVQEHGFSDPRPISIGHLGRKGDRNSMGLVNLRFTHTGLFWDERVATLEEQVLVPLQSPVEMGMTLPEAIAVVKGDDRYAPLVEQAFGDRDVNADRIAKSLAQFVRSLVSYRSKYDEGLAEAKEMADDFANFTAAENVGKNLFRERCSICHQASRGTRAESFETFAALNNGVNPDAEQRDGGQGDLTFEPAAVGLFKASSLRNIEKTAPYMHDGRFATLEDVVEHYSSGIHKHPSVSGFAFRMRFSPEEKAGLIAFLKTLTDEKFLADERFSNPWKVAGETKTAAEEAHAKPAAERKPLSAEERASLIAAGRGLPPGETLPWVRGLDKNGNEKLENAELEPIVQVMLKTGMSPRLNTQRFNRNTLRIGGTGRDRGGPMSFDKDKDGRLTRAEAPESLHATIDTADLNRDDAVDAAELQKFQAFGRLIEIDDQGRVPLRVDQFVASFGVPAESLEAAKEQVKGAQLAFAKLQLERNTALAEQLETALGSEKYDAFRDVILARPDPQPTPAAEEEAAQRLRDRLAAFDADEDGDLAGEEIDQLAAVLEEAPGGFGQVAPEFPNIAMHARRLLAYGSDGHVTAEQVPDRLRSLVIEGDADRDGKLTLAEAQTLLRSRGFRHLLESGVYVGGGFGNVFGNAELLVDRLQLTPAAANEIKALMQSHQQEVKQALTEITHREYRLLGTFLAQTTASAATPAAAPPE